MILAAHQPYFFPYIGYFSLISFVDEFIFFDNVQYTRQSWMTRNRILQPTRNEFQYIHIGVQKPAYRAMLPCCNLTNDEQWKNQLLNQLRHYEKIAPFYNETIIFLTNLLALEDHTLVGFNIRSTTAIAQELNIQTSFELFSHIESTVERANDPGLWGLNISKAKAAKTYINAPGGEALIPAKAFLKEGIELGFIQHQNTPYNQFNNGNFIPGLSILDVLMFNGFKKTEELLHDYTIKWTH